MQWRTFQRLVGAVARLVPFSRRSFRVFRGSIRALRLAGRKPFSCIFYVVEGHQWVVDQVGRQITTHLRRQVGMEARTVRGCEGISRQLLHFGSRNTLLGATHCEVDRSNRLVLSWFHGKLDDGDAIDAEISRRLKALQPRLSKVITTSDAARRRLVLGGLEEELVETVPLGVDLSAFHPAGADEKRRRRASIGVPDGTFCVGSFQKDGVGWGAGYEPKLVKGPDVLADAFAKLARQYPIYVLLTGPSRGYVIRRLQELGIPFRHRLIRSYEQMASYYQCLDLYIVASRDEGGPMAIPESLATGVPLVSTRVGMAPDLIADGRNGFLVDIEDAPGLAEKAGWILGHPEVAARIAAAGLETASSLGWDRIANLYWQRVYRPLLED